MTDETPPATLTFRAPAPLRDQLEHEAAAAGRSISEEIRRRLEGSFAAPPLSADGPTAELLSAISGEAARLQRDFGDWHSDPFAFRVFHGVVARLLAFYRRGAKGEPVAAVKPGGLGWLYGDDPKVRNVVRIEAGMVLQQIAEARL
jgi:hypothetical protein